MPITTISADRVTYINGVREFKPEVKPVLKHGDRGPSGYRCRPYQLQPRLDLVTPGGRVAIDCEGVILDGETSVNKMGCGRVSAVNEDKKIIFDTFSYYPEDVPHRPNPRRFKLGVKYPDIEPENGAQPIAEAIKHVQSIVDRSGLVVGHAFKNDMHMLRGVSFDNVQIYDTHFLPEYRQYARHDDPSLADLSAVLLGHIIQTKGHSSMADARTTMDLYQVRREDIERRQRRMAPSTPLANLSTSETATTYARTPWETTTAAPLTGTSHTSLATQAKSSTTNTTAPMSAMLDSRFHTFTASAIARAPGNLVALPATASMAHGRRFNYRTSLYI